MEPMPAMTREDEIWAACLDLALEGYNAGSMGIASIITDEGGRIVGCGRNHLDDAADSTGAICLSVVAHAEINALHGIGKAGMERRDLTLYTTVEPCPMCLGAIGMSRIRKVLIGSRDPYAGSVGDLGKNAYLKSKDIQTTFRRDGIETICFGLHYLSARRALSDRPGHRFFAAVHGHYGDIVDRIEGGIRTRRIATDRLDRSVFSEFFP